MSRLRLFGALASAAALACVLGSLPGRAQIIPPLPSAAYYDVSADHSQLKKVGEETVLELTGNVRVVHGDVTVTADRGLSFTTQRLTQLFGNVRAVQQTMVMTGAEGEYRQLEDLAIVRKNVRIVDEGWEVTCNEARYSRVKDEAWLVGNVVGKDSTSTIRADRVLYKRGLGLAEAFGAVEISDGAQDIIVRGKHGLFYRDRSEGVVDREPVLVSGPDDPEPITVVSDTMRVFPDSSRATAYYRVKIIKGDMVTQCDSAMLYDDQQRVELYGNPLAKQDNVAMKGERMVAHYNEDEVYQIDILDAASITETQRDSLVAGRDSWIQGDAITLYLHDGGVDSVRVLGKAQSEYYPKNPGKVEGNVIEGEDMFFHFGEDEIDFVDVKGGASGTYRYINLGNSETPDSMRAVLDTTLTYVAFPEKAEKVVYAAERIRYYADREDLVLDEKARVDYKDSRLEAANITYHASVQVLDATGSPTLTDAGQSIVGEQMDYDLEGETGLVIEGSTQYEQGYYSGENMAKVGENEMKVWNSWYTTCDLKEPHYHFGAKHMKVYPDDKAFTGPIWLHIGKTPIFALPFMANSIARGRRSGFLRPDFEFGITSDRGRFISGVGYYWATNDYTDFTFAGDFYEDSRWRLYVGNRYALRYKFNGSAAYNYVRDITDNSTEWTFDGTHNQTLGERFTLNASLRFVSSDDAPQSVNQIDDVNRYIDRSIRSTVSLRKSWETVGFSASASRTQNLSITDPTALKLSSTLPSVQLSIPSWNLYFGNESRTADGVWENLLRNTRVSPSLSFNRAVREKLFETDDVMEARAQAGLSSPQKFGFVTISPSISGDLTSTRVDFQRDAHQYYRTVGSVTDTITVSALDSSLTEHQFTWRTGVGANTNIYGTFYPNIGRLRGLRHTLTPAVNYSFTPSQDGRPRSQSVSLGLRNAIDLKVAPAVVDTTTSEEEKVRRLSGVVLWSLSTSYRPDTPSERAWGNISSGLNFMLLGTNFSINHSIDPYRFDVLSTSATSTIRLGGTHPFGTSSRVEVRELNVAAARDTTRAKKEEFESGGVEFRQTGEYGERPADELQLEEGRQPWNVVLGFTYSKGASGVASSTLRVGWDVKLTDNWRIDYSTIYDIEGRERSGQYIGVTRDLHCWEIGFSRQQLGDEWKYYFRIALKAHPELYGESGDRGVGGGLMGHF
ncbi:MAG TPA: putative LPS assembly protein LptD [Candidatus Krumholzibacteria bacterium]|nr:putative LPS assembly protein LptD [Candidatus Krumholzibacteria bacterium]